MRGKGSTSREVEETLQSFRNGCRFTAPFSSLTVPESVSESVKKKSMH